MVKEKTSGSCHSTFSESVNIDDYGSTKKTEHSNVTKTWKTVRTYEAGSYNNNFADLPSIKRLTSTPLNDKNTLYPKSVEMRNHLGSMKENNFADSSVSSVDFHDTNLSTYNNNVKLQKNLGPNLKGLQSIPSSIYSPIKKNLIADYDSVDSTYSSISLDNKSQTNSTKKSTTTMTDNVIGSKTVESIAVGNADQNGATKSKHENFAQEASKQKFGDDLIETFNQASSNTEAYITRKKNKDELNKHELEYRRKSRAIFMELKENERRKGAFVSSALDLSAQVSRLVILHEEAEDGNAMPDLTRPVDAVSRAVDNLIKVGYDTCHSSDDRILQQDMPPALQRVESSSKLLESACRLLKSDPFSVEGRRMLIEGARGILQGTSALLLCFDESEVRKIIQVCKKVLDYLAVTEVIDNMEDLLQFVKDISPYLTSMSSSVDQRQKELTHQVHAEILVRCIDSIKTLAPILICAMKIYIQIHAQRGRGMEEASENRNYLMTRMMDEVNEIIRVLQLTSYDEDEWDADNLTVMKKAISAIESLLQAALDWLADPRALRGGVGEKSLRRILDYMERIAARALPDDAYQIRRACSDINSMTDSLCELRQNKQGESPQAMGLARGIGEKLKELVGGKDRPGLLHSAIVHLERSGILQPAHTVAGRIEQALRWLDNPNVDDKGLGLHAIKLVTEEGRKVADLCRGPEKYRINQLCDDIDRLANQLADLQRRGLGDSPQAREISAQLRQKLNELKDLMSKALTDRVVEDFSDITTPLKQFTEAALAPETVADREVTFQEKAHNLEVHSLRCAQTGRMVGAAGPCKNKKTVEALCDAANQVANMTPQVINAGKIRLHHANSKSADEHFENLRRQFADALHRLRSLVDDAINASDFVKASEEAMYRYTERCEESIRIFDAQKMVDNTSNIARLANRVLMSAKNEADNSEDPPFVDRINRSGERLQAAIPPMVQDAKQVALNPRDQNAAGGWRNSNRNLLDAVGGVRNAITSDLLPPEQHYPPPPPPAPHTSMRREEVPPPRPPPPAESGPPRRPPVPIETDDEEEMRAFWERVPLPKANQPILSAAHSLHQEVRQWSSHENEIVAAAKRMAILMAKLSQLVRGEGGSKKDLIDCAKAIADASEEVTRLAVQLARQCTDIKMRKSLLQICERIPTIATQLKILSTVKATMLGAQGTDEDEEAMQQLVLNAQNLMQSVKDTVRAAEAASIKIRTDSGLRLRWVRKPVWTNY